MEKHISELHQSLQKLVGFHRQLLDAVRHEREALTQANLKEIQETTCMKESLVQGIRQVEVLRMRAAAGIGQFFKIPLKELTLQKIIIELQGSFAQQAEQLRSTYNALQVLVQRISEQQSYNKELVEKSLEHVHEMKRNVLGEAVPKAETYGRQGQKQPQTGGARLFSKEA